MRRWIGRYGLPSLLALVAVLNAVQGDWNVAIWPAGIAVYVLVSDGLVRSLEAERDRLWAAMDAVRALADEWSTTWGPIIDGLDRIVDEPHARELRAALDEHLGDGSPSTPHGGLMRITDEEWDALRQVHRRRGWRAGRLGALLRVHSPSAHVLGDCWCQRPLRGTIHPPRHIHRPP